MPLLTHIKYAHTWYETQPTVIEGEVSGAHNGAVDVHGTCRVRADVILACVREHERVRSFVHDNLDKQTDISICLIV